jgi:homoserine O-acetyltransferase/O-succinyltransferase
LHVFHSKEVLQLEQGETLPGLDIAYQVFGTLNEQKDNVVWVCHALTGNADPTDWWSGLVGEGRIFDPDKYCIICSNNLGSCYGTTGPASLNPETGEVYGDDFPEITIRDMVQVQQRLLEYLGIGRIHVALGGSMGGQIILEWAIEQPDLFHTIILMATNAVHSPWGIAFNETQRMAIEASLTLNRDHPDAIRKGLEAARAIAMLSYRSYDGYAATQTEEDTKKIDQYKASSYQRYQGEKFAKRFDLYSYLRLSKAMDSHHVGRDRGGVPNALNQVKARALLIGIDTDLLFPLSEQVTIANHIPRARLEKVSSKYGHDGFLVEFDEISRLIRRFMQEGAFRAPGKQYQLSVRSVQVKERYSRTALPGTERF